MPKTTVQNSHLEEIKTRHNKMCIIENLQRQTQRCDTKIYIQYIVVLRSVGNYIIIANLSRANLVCDNFFLEGDTQKKITVMVESLEFSDRIDH